MASFSLILGGWNLSVQKAGIQQTDPELPVSMCRLPDIEIVFPLQVYPENKDPIQGSSERRAWSYLMKSELKSEFLDWISRCVHQCPCLPKQVIYFMHLLWPGSKTHTCKGTGRVLYSKYQDPGQWHFTGLEDSWAHSRVSQFGADIRAEFLPCDCSNLDHAH